MIDKSALLSLIEAFAGWVLVEFVIIGVRELRRDSADRLNEERVVRGYARILAEDEKHSGEHEIGYGHRIGAHTSPQ